MSNTKTIRLKKSDKNEIFSKIIISLMSKKVNKLKAKENTLALKLYNHIYKKQIKLLNELPDGYVPTASRISITTAIRTINLDYAHLLYNSNTYNDFTLTSLFRRQYYLNLLQPKRIRFIDQISSSSGDTNKVTQILTKELESYIEENLKLIEEIKILSTDLKTILNSCTTVKQLTEDLPDFEYLYPKKITTNLPSLIPNITRIKKCIKENKK